MINNVGELREWERERGGFVRGDARIYKTKTYLTKKITIINNLYFESWPKVIIYYVKIKKKNDELEKKNLIAKRQTRRRRRRKT